MLSVLRHPTFARLYAAQVVALLGTGLLTVALALLAYDLAEARAGTVLGTALAIKMVAYVAMAPLANALAEALPRKAVLVAADIVRAAIALMLPYVDEVWQVYLLIFLLQTASATFTPTFQATIPDVLPDEDQYTRALSLSRLAYELENILSPLIAAALLTVMSFHLLFFGTVLGFLASAALVIATRLPTRARRDHPLGFARRLTRGTRIFLATPRLRGLLALNVVAAAGSSFVLVNTVVVVNVYDRATASTLGVALAAFGAGSILAALVLPAILARVSDRAFMLTAAAGLALATLSLAGLFFLFGLPEFQTLLLTYVITGFAFAALMTPVGRLLRRSARAEDRPTLFAAQFALSHLCWLFTYPLAGWAGPVIGLGGTAFLLGLIAVAALVVATRLWPKGGQVALEHDHADLHPDHPHLRDHAGLQTGQRHAHVFVIDDLHPVWPHRD